MKVKKSKTEKTSLSAFLNAVKTNNTASSKTYLKSLLIKRAFLKTIAVFTIVFSSYQTLFAQAPLVDWRRFDWAPKNPTISNSNASDLTFTKDNSGSDWWYDIKNSYDLGSTSEGYPNTGAVHNGFILSGYSNIRYYNDAELNGCNTAQNPQNLDCSYFEEGKDPNAPSSYQTMGKISTNGITLEWFKFLPLNGNGYRVIQLNDGSYIMVGDSKSTRKFDGSPIFYNPHIDISGIVLNEFCGAGTQSLSTNGYIINASFIGVSHILQDGTIDWVYNYGYFDYGTNDLQTASHDAWDVKQSMPSGDIIIVGSVTGGGINDALAINITEQGYLNSKRLLTVEPPVGVSNPGVMTSNKGKTLICRNIGGVEKFVVGCTSYMNISGTTARTRVYVAQFNSDLADNTSTIHGDDWHKWYHDQQFNIIGYDEQNIFSIIHLPQTNSYALGMLTNCSYCLSVADQGPKGDITVLTVSDVDGHVINNQNCGGGNAYDLRVGLCNNIYSNDGGFGLVCSKPQSHPSNRPDFDCTITGQNISVKDYFDADTYIASFNSLGNLIWESTYKDEDIESAPALPPNNYKKQECMYAIAQAPDGGYIAAGNNSSNFDDNYLIKLYPENCADAITDYDIIPNSSGGVSDYDYPSYVINQYAFTGGLSVKTKVWDSSKKVKGSVVIEPGYQLVITGANTVISFDDSRQTQNPSKIIVKPGGKLRIQDGAKLTSYGNCKPGMWDGIEVWGDINAMQDLQYQAQDINHQNEWMSNNQGLVEVIDNAMIDNAVTAITASEPREFTWEDNYSSVSHTGGIIQAENAYFKNNKNDIDIRWYHNLETIDNNVVENMNKSFLRLCTFQNNSILANPAIEESMICPDEPEEMYTTNHVHLWNVNGVKINGCNFNNAGTVPNYTGTGIKSFDAGYTVSDYVVGNDQTPCKFDNFETAIDAGGYNANANVAKIMKSIFNNNERSISITGTMNSVINRNQITIPVTANKKAIGIYAIKAKAYSIKDNILTDNRIQTNLNDDADRGIVSDNNILVSSEIAKNHVNKFFANNQFENDNTWLKVNCNTYSNVQINTPFDWFLFDNLNAQGEACLPIGNNGYLQAPRANLFSKVVDPAVNSMQQTVLKQIFLDNSANSLGSFTYNSFANNMDFKTMHPVDVSAGFNNSYCNIFINQVEYEEQVCQATIYNIAEKISMYNGLLTQVNDIKAVIDKGETEQLLAFITTGEGIDPRTLPEDYQRLLSDEVLLHYTDNAPVTTWNDFKIVMLYNSPLSAGVLATLNTNTKIPPAIVAIINNAQSGISPRAEVDKVLEHFTIEKNNVMHSIVADMLEEGHIGEAYNFLNTDNSFDAHVLALPLAIQLEQSINPHTGILIAAAKLNQRTAGNNELLNEVVNLIDYNNLLQENASMLKQRRNSLTDFFPFTASNTDANKEVMFEVFNLHKKIKHYPKVININNSYRIAQHQADVDAVIENKTIEIESADVVLKPNPANDNFVISTNKIIDYIQITDALGNEVLQIKNYTSNSLINTNSLSSGLYFVKINTASSATYKSLIISK